ncbi:MAG: hypothetical protein ABDK94_08635 [Atribacterota bacterium]
MNRDEPIERITREVISKLQNVPLAGNEGSSEDKIKLTLSSSNASW